MNHAANLITAVDRAFALLECESTPAELGQHLTAAQVNILRDAESMLHDILAARPAIQPAREWRNPTEVRRAVAERLNAQSERGITRRRGRAVAR